MKKSTPLTNLQESILLLEMKQANEEALLKTEFKDTFESLKPINLVKNTIDEFMGLPNLKANILDTSLSLVAGYLSKKAVFGNSKNPFKQMIGSLLQMGITNVALKKIPNVRLLISHFAYKKDTTSN